MLSQDLLDRATTHWDAMVAAENPADGFPHIAPLVALIQDELNEDQKVLFASALQERYGLEEVMQVFQGLPPLLQQRAAMLPWVKQVGKWGLRMKKWEDMDSTEREEMQATYSDLRDQSANWRSEFIAGLTGIPQALVDGLCMGGDSEFQARARHFDGWLNEQSDERFAPDQIHAMLNDYMKSADGVALADAGAQIPAYADCVREYNAQKIAQMMGYVMSQGVASKRA